MCGICLESKPTKKSYVIKGCNHSYCSECIHQYVTTKIQDDVIQITCPVSGCYGSLKPQYCRSVVDVMELDEWKKKLREAAIPACDKFYCPYENCSALMVKGPDFKYMPEMNCTTCRKLFCAKCMVPWHTGMTCVEFQNLHLDENEREDEDIMLILLAKNKKWCRCSNCKFYVERSSGCSIMICRKSTVPSSFTCGICTDRKPSNKCYCIKGCYHFYCSDCICQYVTSKIQDNLIPITCPVLGCYRSLEPKHCRSILPAKVLDVWGMKLWEASVPVGDRVYCPYNLCSELMAKGPDFKDILEMECTTCLKLFCTKCMVPWHAGKTCVELKKLQEDDRGEEMLKQLAKEKKWTQCSNCKFYVERKSGCSHMRCRKFTVPPSFGCGICTDRKPSHKSFSIKGCSHSYCSDCICQYVTSKIQDNIIRITCPVSGCYRYLKPEHCRSILPPKVFDAWGMKLWEAAIPVGDRLYCPYKLCSALMVKRPDYKDILEMECTTCHKLFCAECMVPWHEGMNCEEFQKLHVDEREQEDIMLMQLAKSKQWKRCWNCKFYVERNQGCSHMRCRCGYDFCYDCGDQLGSFGHACIKSQQ
ncbi:hypothetical protein POM88_048265 [Heracleum sosnowskyi]|uniref:RBR-type E3 ubiquitin transferase n=1 Tax=Heracleum sosnowskyi TaxID=360622 RepID=A0AAD8M0B5_9APIA|nr:hypothetical protein POM88_048265 [Heracleum sosnowskyi]